MQKCGKASCKVTTWYANQCVAVGDGDALSKKAIYWYTALGLTQEKAEQKPSNLPQAAPAQQAKTLLPDKVITKGKIVGTAKVSGKGIVDVEEREVETYGIGDKRIVEKRYYQAGTDNRIFGYAAQQQNNSTLRKTVAR